MIVTNNPEHGHAVARGAGVTFNPAVDVVLARVVDGELRGGVIFNNYTGASINVHIWGKNPKWIDRDLLWMTCDYMFKQLGCKKVFAQIPANNKRSLDFSLNFGFKIEARIADVFPDEDLFVLSMLREDCRWLNLRPSKAFLKEEAA